MIVSASYPDHIFITDYLSIVFSETEEYIRIVPIISTIISAGIS